MAESVLSTSSFDKDGHAGAIARSEMCSVDANLLARLRLDIVKLIIEVTSKFQSVRKCVQVDALPRSSSNNCEDDSICSDSPSTACTSSESMCSDDSDSTYHDDSQDEPDCSNQMYCGADQYDNDLPNNGSVPPVDRTHTPNNPQHEYNDTSDDDDASSVEEMYTDFREGHRSHSSEKYQDNLICPGDVLEYCRIDGNQTAKRDAVKAIVDGSSDAMVTLNSGVVLRPNVHSVRKVKFYDGVNDKLIPNPLAQWQRLDNCTLQPGSVESFNEVSDENTEGGDGEAMEVNECRARAERRKQNKQRQVRSSVLGSKSNYML